MRYAFLLDILLLVLAFCPSCTVRKTAGMLDAVESCIWERPDSALATIRQIDTATLRTRSLRAHYALLHAMALDKNWIDTTDEHVVMPAVTYYDRYGSADQKMKAWYYLGRIRENAGEMEDAIVAFTLAKEASTDATDLRFKGLLHFGMSYIYKRFHEVDRAIELTTKGMTYFLEIQDTLRYNRSMGHLASMYQEKGEWTRADSLYRKSLQLLGRDTFFMVKTMKDYASMNVLRPDPDPQEAVDLLNRCRNEYNAPLRLKEYGIYAYASALLGDDRTCDEILAMIQRQPEQARAVTWYMEYKIAKYRGDIAQALEMHIKTLDDQTKLVRELLNHSIDRALNDYYEAKSSDLRNRSTLQRLVWTIVLLLLILVVGVVAFCFIRKRNRERERLERLMQLSEESKFLLQNENAGLESRIAELQHQYGQLFKGQLAVIGELSKTYFRTKQTREMVRKEEIFRKVEEMISVISENDDRHAEFEELIDSHLDNIITHLKMDLGPMNRLDERFLCYTVAGFDAATIAFILGLSLSNVYTKRSRLKERIYQLESPYSAQYNQVI